VPVAFEVAQALKAPLDVFLVRKLGVPGQEELAMGAIASGGSRVLNDDVVQSLEISDAVIEAVAEEERRELERRERVYRLGRRAPELRGKTVILVDDGLATGASMRAAVAAVGSMGPARVVVAIPLAPAQTCRVLADLADEVICLTMPHPFIAIGIYYDEFPQVTDLEVQELLSRGGANTTESQGVMR
jgi:putative phosphoribosyl transferase